MMWSVAVYLPSRNGTGWEESLLRLGDNGTTSIKFSLTSFCAIFFSSSLSGLSLSPHHWSDMGFSSLGVVLLNPAPCTEMVLRLPRIGECVVSALFGFSREHQRSFISLTALRCTQRPRCGGLQTSRTRWPALHSSRQSWMVLRLRRGRSERRVNGSTVTTPLLRSGRRSQAKFTTILLSFSSHLSLFWRQNLCWRRQVLLQILWMARQMQQRKGESDQSVTRSCSDRADIRLQNLPRSSL